MSVRELSDPALTHFCRLQWSSYPPQCVSADKHCYRLRLLIITVEMSIQTIKLLSYCYFMVCAAQQPFAALSSGHHQSQQEVMACHLKG